MPGESRISSLSQLESAAYIAAVLRLLVSLRGPAAVQKYYETIESDVVDLIVSQARTPSGRVQGVVRAIEQLESDAPASAESYRIIRSAPRLLRRLQSRYPICIAIAEPLDGESLISLALQESLRPSLLRPPTTEDQWRPRRIRFTVRMRTLWDYGFHNRGGRRRTVDLIRAAFGVRTPLVAYPLYNAARAKSYHLEIQGPAGTFLSGQAIIKPSRQVAAVTAHAVAQRRAGQRHAHLYLHDAADMRDNSYRAVFEERMPGSMAPAALSAISVAVLIGLGFIATLVGARETEDIGTAWEYVAITLAFPVVISAWAGVDSSRDLFAGLLVSKMSSLASIVLAVLASALDVVRPHNGTSAPFWASLFLLAALNSAVACGSWWTRARVQSYFISKEI